MRSSSKIVSVSVFVFMIMTVGCAAPLSNLQRAEQAYQYSEAERKAEEEAAKAARAKADEAARAETEAGKGLSTALVQDADERVKYVEQQLKQAEEQRKRACILNPQLDICKKAAQPPPPQVPAAAAPQPPHVDFLMGDFTKAGMNRLTSLPVGWEIGYDASKGNIYLVIDGVEKYKRSKPDNFKPGICYRFLKENVIACPAATAP